MRAARPRAASPAKYTVCLAFRREGSERIEGAVAHVVATGRASAPAQAHDELIFNYGSDDIDPASVIVVAVFAGHIGYTVPDSI